MDITKKSTYSVIDISFSLNVDPETVRRWIRNGKLRGHMFSRKEGYLVSEEDFEAFLKTHLKRRKLVTKDAYIVLDKCSSQMDNMFNYGYMLGKRDAMKEARDILDQKFREYSNIQITIYQTNVTKENDYVRC